MKQLLCAIVVFQITNFVSTNFSWETNRIKNFNLTQCDSKTYPVIVTDVQVQIGTKPKVTISGTLQSKVDLVSPIKASVWVERDVFGIWIPIPCEKNMGSCTYNDLCDFGYPTNKSCSHTFIDNNVPCRCPISRGNYTIQPTFLLSESTSILSGSYKGSVTVAQNKVVLSCYNFYFELYNDLSEQPVVMLVR